MKNEDIFVTAFHVVMTVVSFMLALFACIAISYGGSKLLWYAVMFYCWYTMVHHGTRADRGQKSDTRSE
jgi:hypothetical protein